MQIATYIHKDVMICLKKENRFATKRISPFFAFLANILDLKPYK